ncbi:hypothetical protein [Hymenobacter rubripertinctus]|uniref:Uncharacterized protein n=1 Tax=Hymenobacter rubripertinctus TaxID=2029981 RepID=A0A418QY35_9BACT|nr:hypothetical protein [Hymenobacter rubripertinctus]RIY10049.1 hypothetical protein D0T11_10950 [Hymenobacter rubripertinctus]
MKASKKLLLDQLTIVLLPHLALPSASKLPKNIGKTIEHLTDQILRQRAKRSAAKTTRQALTDQLAGLLDTHLHGAEELARTPEVTRVITQSAGKLAGKLTKLHPARVGPEPTAEAAAGRQAGKTARAKAHA